MAAYAVSTAAANAGAMFPRSNAARMCTAAVSSAAGSSQSTPASTVAISASSPLAATNSAYAAVVATKPPGTRKPARTSRARLSPLPPALASVALGESRGIK